MAGITKKELNLEGIIKEFSCSLYIYILNVFEINLIYF